MKKALKVHKVEVTDLPFSCSGTGDMKKLEHPKVYIPLEGNDEAPCPYCGAIYVIDSKSKL